MQSAPAHSTGGLKKKSFSDYLVGLGVVACSAVLLAALTLALTGVRDKKGDRTLEIDFADVTGIRLHSELRYAGAPAGAVSGVRLLTAEERLAAPRESQGNAVRVSVRLMEGMPELPADVHVSIASDTLLSEKFIAFSAGSPGAPKVASGTVLQGVSAASFDSVLNSLGPVVHDAQLAIASLAPLMKNAGDTVESLKTGLNDFLPRLNAVAESAKATAANAGETLKHADKLISENEGGVKANLEALKGALGQLQESLKRVDGLVGRADGQIGGRMQELSVVLQNLKVATTQVKSFTKAIGEKPSRVIFSGKPQELPSEESILKSRQPVPAR